MAQASVRINDKSSDMLISRLKDFDFLVSRPQSIQRDEAVYIFLEPYEKLFSLKAEVMTIPLEKTNRAIYIHKIFLDTVCHHVLDKVLSPGGLAAHLKEYERIGENYAVAINDFAHLYADEKVKFLKVYERLLSLMHDIADFIWVPFAIDRFFSQQYYEQLMQSYPADYEGMYQATSSPTVLNEYQKMRLALCDAVIGNVNDELASRKLADAYGWYGEYSFVEPLYDEEYFMKELHAIDKRTACDEKERILNEVEKNRKNFAHMRAKIKDEKLLAQADLINTYTFLRTDRVDSYKKLQASARSIFDGIARLLAAETNKPWTRREVVKLLNAEIITYLSGVATPTFDDMEKRDQGIYYRHAQQSRVFTDPVMVANIIDALIPREEKLIKGAVAYGGVAEGRVVMVFGKDDLHKVTEGIILVARTTMPDYTPAMKIAAAFVTDEGGVTSHAAIIARELKKPCIIGTKIATQVLKDGMLVEVDADKGVVRILEN